MPKAKSTRPPSEQRIPVIPYVRVSSIKGRRDDRLLSPELQLDDEVKALDEEYGKGKWRFYCDPFVDLDKTGAGTRREQFLNAVALAKSDEFSTAAHKAGKAVFAVYNIARWSRELGGQAGLLVDLQHNYGVECLSAKQGVMDLSTREGALKFGLHNLIDHDQLLGIGEDWQDAIRHLMDAGHYHGPTAPFGYKYRYPEHNPDKPSAQRAARELVVDEEAAAVVHRAFELAADITLSLTPALRCLQDGGYKTSSVHRLLRNPVYVGKVRVHETKPTKRLDSHGRVRRERTGEYKDVLGLHEPIVRQDLFDRVQERLGLGEARGTPSPHALSGLVFCAGCGHPVSKKNARKTGPRAGSVYLGCKSRLRRVADCDGMGAALLDQVVDATFAVVNAALVMLVESEGETAHAKAAAKNGHSGGESPSTLEAKLDRTRKMIVAAMKKQLAAEVDGQSSEYDDVVEELRAEQANLNRRLAAALAAQQRVSLDPKKQLRLLHTWDAATPEERNGILRALGVRVEVRKALRWREPMSRRVAVGAPWFTVTRKTKDDVRERR